jgi:hypothetical protein
VPDRLSTQCAAGPNWTGGALRLADVLCRTVSPPLGRRTTV